MKASFSFLVTGTALLLSASAALAQIVITNAGTNALPLVQTLKYQVALEQDRSLGERSLLPPGLKEKMKLTDEQRAELKPIEDDFANTSQLYQIANQPRIDAAQEASRQARVAKDATQIKAARKQVQNVWAGLQPDRTSAVVKMRYLLTPAQTALLDDTKNQWRENHGDEANDPSAN